MVPAPALLAVAVVVAGAAVELVSRAAAVEAVVAGAAVAAVLARAHDADVAAAAAPAAVAAVAVVAEVVAAAADAVAVAVAGDADVVVAAPDAAVAARAFGEADVPLAFADELVGAAAEVDDQRQGQGLRHLDLVALRPHVDFDRADAAQRADGLAAAAGEMAAARVVVRQVALDHDLVVAARVQAQRRPLVGAENDDLGNRRGGGRQDHENGSYRQDADQQPAAGGRKHRAHINHVYRLTKPRPEDHTRLCAGIGRES